MQVAEPLSTQELAKTPGVIRQSAQLGEVRPVLFHRKVVSWLVPDQLWGEALQALAEKRARDEKEQLAMVS